MKESSYSGTFMRWAEPLLHLAAELPKSARQSALDIATTTWNAVTLEDAGVAPGAIAELKERLDQLPAPGPELFRDIVADLIHRRRNAFADARWTIGKCEFRGTGDKLRVYLEARAIPART